MRNILLVAGLLSAVACSGKDSGSESTTGGSSGGNACQEYIDAVSACYGEMGLSLEDYGLSSDYCSAYEGVSDYDSLFECYTSAINSADCSTEEGLTAMGESFATCG